MAKKLYLLPQNGYNQSLYTLLKKEISKVHVCYVSLNKTALSVVEGLKAKSVSVENIFFLDAVTPKIFEKSPQANCEYITEPEDLNALAERIFTCIHHHKSKLLIFDSLSSLIVRLDQAKAVQFLQYLSSFADRLGCDLIFLGLSVDKNTPVIKQVQMMID